VIRFTVYDIVYIGSTVFWLLSLVVAILASREALKVKDKDTIDFNLTIAIINTVVWATAIMNVGYPWWPPFAFTLLDFMFLVELFNDP